ncbi:DPP IV N-terminal domain-containing protein [Nonomuraea typhae]|uniref:DPP IV N-terminal domain-containing protein n=1 Tax=Nonomuraea typhae TaxID=2603600 RepID=A0ABW7Z431_9ACTN
MGRTSYEAAERLLRHNRAALVRGGKINPQWDGARFWYTVDTRDGKRFILVDPAAGSREPAFDHHRLAAALAAATGQEVNPAALPFSGIELSTDAVEFFAFGSFWRCRLDTYTCAPAPRDTAYGAGFLEVPSPDGKLVAFLRGHDLWARSAADGREWPLTTDGQEDHEYGATPFAPSVLPNKLGLRSHLPPALAWSPDSTRVLTHRTDQRAVRRTQIMEALPADGGVPRPITQRYAYPGDTHMSQGEFVVIEAVTGHVVKARTAPEPMPLVSPITSGWAWWAQDGSAVYYLSQPRDQRSLHLNRLDPATGQVRTVLSESGPTRVEPNQTGGPPIVQVLSGGSQVLWYSQRDGWGHLYLYDAHTGTPIRQITSGAWAVQRILHVDEVAHVVYFTASGLVAEDPYRESVCRVNLDGTGFARITGDDLHHVVTVSPAGDCFIDSASTIEHPPVSTVRGWDGRVLVELEQADITPLLATGWTPPQRFRATAADGVTDVYGIIYRPHDFDPGRRYPVIDHVYPGPQSPRVSPSFDPGILGQEAEVLAALGFVVIAADGRGTPGRDKAFHDASYGNQAAAGGIDDHVAALQQLAATCPWMDLDRVGVTGHSGGGFAAVRAMLAFPDLYKVGVAESGNHDTRLFHLHFAEAYDGQDPAAWTRSSNVELADRLNGKLLLIHGGVDDVVHVHHSLRLAERLMAADKDVELLVVPGAEHFFIGYEHHINRRKWDFLIRNLMGIEPPRHRLTPVAPSMELIVSLFS